MILLEELNTEFGNIKIVQSSHDGTCSYYQEACFHSQINAEGISTCGYVHVMHSVIRQSQARRVLMIGCAGGTLATMLHHSGCEVTVVDINPHAFTLAKKYFRMPEAIKCVTHDGWEYLLKTRICYDAIAIDAFNINATVPDKFTTGEFFHIVRKALSPFGAVTMNVMVAHDLDLLADHIALNMECAGIPAVLFDHLGKRDRNVVIAGGAVAHIHINSERKPACVRQELSGMIRRGARGKSIAV